MSEGALIQAFRLLEAFTYDTMGNVTALTRQGFLYGTTWGTVDDLVMEYEGNRLARCDDAADTQPTYSGAQHFNDLADETAEYEYDENGNMTKDLNRKISKIEYNSLNLPSHVAIEGDGEVTHIENTYDSMGNKLQTMTMRQAAGIISPMGTAGTLSAGNWQVPDDEKPSPGTTKPYKGWPTTDYCGNAVYQTGKLSMLLTGEGYVTFTNDTTPVYHYYLRDHLGSVRVVFSEDGTVEQQNDYYPSGALMATSTGGTVQPYKYGGKELQREAGLDMYDYGARWMDPVVGPRFTTMGPLCEKYYDVSPYAYCGGDPENRIDPSGRIWEDPQEAQRLKDKIDKRIENLNNSISIIESKLSDSNLNDKKRQKLERKISEKQNMISNLSKSLQDIDMLGDDEETVFRFEHTKGGRHSVYSPEVGLVVIQTSSDAMSIHEITHLTQSASFGGADYNKEGFLKNAGSSFPPKEQYSKISMMEIDAYKRQYSFDMSFPGYIHELNGIDVHSVGKIKDENGIDIYPIIHKYSNYLKKLPNR